MTYNKKITGNDLKSKLSTDDARNAFDEVSSLGLEVYAIVDDIYGVLSNKSDQQVTQIHSDDLRVYFGSGRISHYHHTSEINFDQAIIAFSNGIKATCARFAKKGDQLVVENDREKQQITVSSKGVLKTQALKR